MTLQGQSFGQPLAPFLKWAGGKRWLTQDPNFEIPEFQGRYIEPFLGSGAIFFSLAPKRAILSDINQRLIECYIAIRDNPAMVQDYLKQFQRKHSSTFYYEERARRRRQPYSRAAQFLYLNRTCWNGLYRENRRGEFNVPIGTKTQVLVPGEDLSIVGRVLKGVDLQVSDFEKTISKATKGDLVFADPPYTTAHNQNGFVKYNQNIFSWADQIRLKSALSDAADRGAIILTTNADHPSLHELYGDDFEGISLHRSSVISGKSSGRGLTSEMLYVSIPR